MAELERSIMRERIMAGQDYAREHGTKSGKQIGRPKVVCRRDRVIELRQQGWSWRQISKELDIGKTTVRRIYDEAAAQTRMDERQSPGESLSANKR